MLITMGNSVNSVRVKGKKRSFHILIANEENEGTF